MNPPARGSSFNPVTSFELAIPGDNRKTTTVIQPTTVPTAIIVNNRRTIFATSVLRIPFKSIPMANS